MSLSASPIEALFAAALRRRGRELFVQQFRIGPYRVDFYLPEYKIVVECDGKYWHVTRRGARARDARRDKYMVARGFRVVRFTGSAIKRSPDKCVALVLKLAAKWAKPVLVLDPAEMRLRALGDAQTPEPRRCRRARPDEDV